ncbi:MAG: menaquinone biosynthetic enzyme MqnA/MqnD family protein [Desulfovibrionales bacterium]
MPQPYRIGRIDYLNVWPLFRLLKQNFPPGPDLEYIPGHPSELNRRLEEGRIEMAPCSSFEFLIHADRYCLLPDMSISAQGAVQSVLFCSPVPVERLAGYLAEHRNTVSLTSASATSVALLKILWKLHWKLPAPRWVTIPPGSGRKGDSPFLEIGDKALDLTLNPPPGMYLIDLAAAWEEFVSLPFVFAVWIVRAGLTGLQRRMTGRIAAALQDCKKELSGKMEELSRDSSLPASFSPDDVLRYWQLMDYDLGPEEQAGLLLFGHYCRELSLIPSVPGLSWFRS